MLARQFVRFAIGKALTLVTLIFCSSMTFAQLEMIPSPAEFDAPHPHKLGSFDVIGLLEAAWVPTSNIKLDSTEESDVQRIFLISGSASSDWPRHAVETSFEVLVQDVADAAHDAQDNEAVSASIAAHYEINDQARLIMGAQRQQSIIGKDHVDQLNGFKHGLSTNDLFQVGSEWSLKGWSLGIEGQLADIYTENDIEFNALQIRQSLDRRELDTTLDLERRFLWGRAYAFTGTQSVRYDASKNLGMSDRDSDGWRIGGGLEFRHGNWQGAMNLIFFAQDFQTTGIEDATSIVGSLDFTYRLNDRFAMSSLIDRSFFETNIEGSAGIYATTYFIGLMYAPTPSSYIKFGPSVSRSRLAGSNSATEQTSLDVEFGSKLSPKVDLIISASSASQTVNDPSLLDQQYDVDSLSFAVRFWR